MRYSPSRLSYGSGSRPHAATYAADHAGSYAGLEPNVLEQCEPAIQRAAGNNNAYVSAAEEIESGGGYEVTASSRTAGHFFTVTGTAAGVMKRECTSRGKTGAEGGGWQNRTW
jgi:hypothetical protein